MFIRKRTYKTKYGISESYQAIETYRESDKVKQVRHLKPSSKADNKISIKSLVDISLSQSKDSALKGSEIRIPRNMQGILESIRVRNEQRNTSA